VWGGDDAAVMLEFDEQERLCHKTWFDADDSLRGRLRRYVPWI
jgi:hypothetical protein